ncbi:MAG TPA: serine protease, partial [Rhodospirillaceae bacterium]|nr:serine protease [Rhodospirillaceae bacterium]
PLVALDGGVVGINSAIYSRSGGSLGIGFAIPSEMVATVLAAEKSGQAGQNGVTRPWLGVTAQLVTADIAASLGLGKPGGALISRLHPASPLKKA